MTITETLGHYRDRTGAQCEYLTLAFSALRGSLRSRWRNNGLSADFLGDYVLTFIPSNDTCTAARTQKQIRHAVSYIVNELLENAMKYHERSMDVPIMMHLELASNYIAICTSNAVDTAQTLRYKTFINVLLNSDTDNLLFSKLEGSIDSAAAECSGMGLLTMINDYGAELGWRFDVDPIRPESCTVTTTVVLSLENMLGDAE